jgi:general nucleoside transport system permease protein
VSRLPRGWRAVAWAGVVVGVLAALVALPPIEFRNPFVPAIVGLVALTVGIGTFIRGERRIGGYAIAAGVLGLVIGVLATHSSVTKLDTVVVWGALFAAMLRYATPLAFASLGGLFSERSGVVNIGLEGMMLTGAFFAIWGSDQTGTWALGLLIGIAAGGLMGLLHAFFSISLRADQIVGGTAINFLALGITSYLYVKLYGARGTPSDVSVTPDVHLGFLGHGFLGDVFGRLDVLVWAAIVLIFVVWVVVFKTSIGLRIRACGEHPRAADTVGINVYAIRYAAVIISGTLAAMGGAFLSLGLGAFTPNMTAGRGFIALAALIFGNWRPFGAAAACLLFGFASALGVALQTYSLSISTLFTALPYVITLIAVAGVIGRSIPPAAVGKPYVKQ